MAVEDTQPVKRGPGRPRKSEVGHQPKHAAPDPAPKDPRIGQKCDPSWLSVGYDDGTEYRCENGKIVERMR